jgi:unconventional prefoldin RPB5 interactor 1
MRTTTDPFGLLHPRSVPQNMAAPAQQTMESVESRRLQLEETVAKFRKALDHWSTWEMEYQILKEELQAAGSPSPSHIAEIGRDIHGQLVTEKEVEELLGKNLTSKRTANQVIDMISRRLDYVGQNRDSVEKQFEKAQKQLEALELLTDQGLENEEGLPLMDIEEQLDDDDNVVSSSVTQPGKVAPQLVEALRKAGVQKSEQKEPQTKQNSTNEPSTSSDTSNSAPVSDPVKVPENLSPPSAISKGKSKASEPPKKSVSFANDVRVETFEKPKTLQDDVQNWNLPPGAKIYEMDDEMEDIVERAVVPDTDTPEEAALRKEMLQYGLSEVNDVVAELNLEDDDEDVDDDYDGYDSEVSEEEDKFGRTTRRVLSDDYVQEMRELEKKLNARMLENIGPNSDLLDKAGDARTLRVRNDDQFEDSMATATPAAADTDTSEKNVASEDYADMPDAPQPSAEPSVPIKLPPTISDTIVERAPSVPRPPSAPAKPAKASRFKSARANNGRPTMLPTPAVPEPPPVPTGPKGSILASTVAEHTPHFSEPRMPDELDPVIHSREITAEYHKLRNKMIQQQGGFTPTEEDENDPLVEERNGQTKKVSRFKAAKLKAEGL